MGRKSDKSREKGKPFTLSLGVSYIENLNAAKARGQTARSVIERALDAFWPKGPWKAPENAQTVADLGPEPAQRQDWIEWNLARLAIEKRDLEKKQKEDELIRAAERLRQEPLILSELETLQGMTDLPETIRQFQAAEIGSVRREALHRRIMELRELEEMERKARQSWQPVEV